MIKKKAVQTVCRSEDHKGEQSVDRQHVWNILRAVPLKERGVDIISKKCETKEDDEKYSRYPNEFCDFVRIDLEVFFEEFIHMPVVARRSFSSLDLHERDFVCYMQKASNKQL